MTIDEKLELAIGTLADIAFSDDMTEEVVKAKAKRIYQELTADLPEYADD